MTVLGDFSASPAAEHRYDQRRLDASLQPKQTSCGSSRCSKFHMFNTDRSKINDEVVVNVALIFPRIPILLSKKMPAIAPKRPWVSPDHKSLHPPTCSFGKHITLYRSWCTNGSSYARNVSSILKEVTTRLTQMPTFHRWKT